jgi:hypothetical protein
MTACPSKCGGIIVELPSDVNHSHRVRRKATRCNVPTSLMSWVPLAEVKVAPCSHQLLGAADTVVGESAPPSRLRPYSRERRAQLLTQAIAIVGTGGTIPE